MPTFEAHFGDRSILRLWFAQLVLYSEALNLPVPTNSFHGYRRRGP